MSDIIYLIHRDPFAQAFMNESFVYAAGCSKADALENALQRYAGHHMLLRSEVTGEDLGRSVVLSVKPSENDEYDHEDYAQKELHWSHNPAR